MDFKEQWRVLVGLLGEGSGAADMFCRILVAIDEDIVSLDIPRSPDGGKASMEFKVTIAAHCILAMMTLLAASGSDRARQTRKFVYEVSGTVTERATWIWAPERKVCMCRTP
jgi:hypothetical protein